MTEEQKKFKILKRTSYEEQISQENDNTINNIFNLGITALGALIAFSVAKDTDIKYINRIVGFGLGLASTGFSFYRLKKLIESICRKTNLQIKVEDINSELEMLENEESRGISK